MFVFISPACSSGATARLSLYLRVSAATGIARSLAWITRDGGRAWPGDDVQFEGPGEHLVPDLVQVGETQVDPGQTVEIADPVAALTDA